MDAWRFWILLQDPPVFLFPLIPFSLFFQGFGIQLMSLRGLRGALCKFLRLPRGDIGIGVDGDIKYLRIMGKFVAEDLKKIQRLVKLIQSHRTVQTVEPDPAFQIFVRKLTNTSL